MILRWNLICLQFPLLDFISFLDGDDFWMLNKLERELKWFESHPNADLVFSWSLIVDEHGESLGILKFPKDMKIICMLWAAHGTLEPCSIVVE